MRVRHLAVLALLVASCEGRTVGVTPPCPADHDRIGRTCIARFPACPIGTIPIVGGGCERIGVPSNACLPGFVADAQLGCAPVLPGAPCVPGYTGVPGDALCHAVVRCPMTSGPWDSIPVTGTVLYVNGAYAGGANDGTPDRPYARIQDALDSIPAAGDVTIAIAPGTYTESLSIRDLTRTVKLWGRCPADVVLRGATATRDVVELAGPSELHQLAITGGAAGVSIERGARAVLLDGLWIHNTNAAGLRVAPVTGNVRVRSSLIERNHQSVEINSGNVVIERTAIVNPGPMVSDEGAPGIEISGANLILQQSLIEGSKGPGIDAIASDVTIVASVIRRSELGVGVRPAIGVSTEGGTLEVLDSLIDAHHDSGIRVAAFDLIDSSKRVSTLRVERSVVRGELEIGPGLISDRGIGIEIERGIGTIKDSLIVSAHYVGVSAINSQLAMERTIVRDTIPSSAGNGFGVWVSHRLGGGELTLRRCAIVGSSFAGLAVDGSRADVSECVIAKTALDRSTGAHGSGVLVRAIDDKASGVPSSATLTTSLLTENAGAAAELHGGALSISSSVLSCNGSSFVEQPLVFQPKLEVAATGCGCGALVGCR